MTLDANAGAAPADNPAASTVLDAPDTATQDTTSPGNGAAAETTATEPALWPDDWRTRMAGEDAKALKRLERFVSPDALFKSYRELEAKVSAGQKTVLPENATPEQMAQWRKDNGIPEAPDGYDLGDLAIDANSKEAVGAFLTAMHGANASPAVVKAALGSYYALKDQQEQARHDADLAAKAEAEEVLRAEWGGNYRAELARIQEVLALAPEGVRAPLLSARLGDGTPLFSHPDALRYFAHLAREINPAATVVPAGSDPMRATEGRIAELEGMMSDTRSAYWSGPSADKLQAEYRDLIVARDKLARRA